MDRCLPLHPNLLQKFSCPDHASSFAGGGIASESGACSTCLAHLYVQKSVAAYGAFVDIGTTTDGLVHISQLSHSYVKDVNDHISPGQKISVKLLKIEGENKLSLSIKEAAPGKLPPSPSCPVLHLYKQQP